MGQAMKSLPNLPLTCQVNQITVRQRGETQYPLEDQPISQFLK